MIDRINIIIGIENNTAIGQHIQGFYEWLETRTNQQLADDYFNITGVFIRPVFHDKFMEV
jgi:hypothetical protein